MGDIGDYWREAKEYKKRRNRTFVTRCLHCGKEFETNEALLEKGLHKFCSKEHRIKHTEIYKTLEQEHGRKPTKKELQDFINDQRGLNGK